MARIRTIKPEFPQSESIGKLSRDARLLYIQLWTIVDDSGRARAASRMLASLLYPYDDDARDLIEGWLAELELGGHICRYEVEGNLYLEVCKWLEHQKIDHASKSRFPEPREDSRDLARVSRSLAPDLGPRTMDLGPSIRAVAKATRPNPDFEEFWEARPRRKGADPKEPARKLYEVAAKTVPPAELLAALKRYKVAEADHANTPYLPQMVKWLRDKRWNDYPQITLVVVPEAVDWDAILTTFKKTGHWSKWAGPDLSSPACRVPPEMLSKHGLLPDGRIHAAS